MSRSSCLLRLCASALLLAQAGCATAAEGDADDPVTRARLVSGALKASDYPQAANGAQGIVVMRLAISAQGRVTGCAVTGTSGSLELDRGTCDLVAEHFRFQPAVDGEGRAVASKLGWRQRWWRD